MLGMTHHGFDATTLSVGCSVAHESGPILSTGLSSGGVSILAVTTVQLLESSLCMSVLVVDAAPKAAKVQVESLASPYCFQWRGFTVIELLGCLCAVVKAPATVTCGAEKGNVLIAAGDGH